MPVSFSQSDFLKKLSDVVQVAANGVTLGGVDWAASKLGEKDSAAKTAAAHKRLGFAGDVVDAATLIVPGAAALKGAGLAWKGLKAARGAGMVPGVVARHPYLSTAAAAITGQQALANYNARTGGGEAQAAPARASTAKSAPAIKKNTRAADKMADSIMSGLDMLGSSPPTFQDMAQATADSQGGKISLRQLDALAGITQRIAPRSSRLPRPGEESGRIYERMLIEQLGSGRMHPDEFEEKVLQLNKSQLIDPYGLNQDYEGQ